MMLESPWAGLVDKNAPLLEYPRMQLQRGSYTNLNGVWEFAITDGRDPGEGDWASIVVPFALGSRLSGTEAQLKETETLFYRRHFSYVRTGVLTLLNFEAVDQCCTVYLNGICVGGHCGGYSPFSLDVTSALEEENELIVKVTDQSDRGLYAYGKQKIDHSGMWYTPSSGIWQTVWMEDLPEHAVSDVKFTPDCANACLYVRLAGTYTQLVITVFEGETLVHRGITNKSEYTVPLPGFHAWSTEDPFLYTIYFQTEEETVKSYFAMRSFSKGPDRDGMIRFRLNDKPLFLSGLLDQGYNVDGLMTYPCDAAMQYELQKVKSMGFNMLRKHIKQECRRWYYLCDLYGILVMQDMPSGGQPYDPWYTSILPTLGFVHHKDDDARSYALFGRSDAQSRANYFHELDEMLDTLYNSPCIFAWVPFNEGWGQFDSAKVCAYIQEYDTTRLLDAASGWHDQRVGDFHSRHCYFRRFKVPHGKDPRILLLSEFGGYSYVEKGHSAPKKEYGYKRFKDRLKLSEAVLKCFEQSVLEQIRKGLSGCIYTQIADVEDECNGLFTADRRILKVDEGKMRRMNQRCIRSVR